MIDNITKHPVDSIRERKKGKIRKERRNKRKAKIGPKKPLNQSSNYAKKDFPGSLRKEPRCLKKRGTDEVQEKKSGRGQKERRVVDLLIN